MSLISDTEIMPMLKSFCAGDQIIWNVNNENCLDAFKSLVDLIEKNNLPNHFVLRSILIAQNFRIKFRDVYYCLAKSFLDKYENIEKKKEVLDHFERLQTIKQRNVTKFNIIMDDLQKFLENIQKQNKEKEDYLSLACVSGSINIFKYLIENGSEITEKAQICAALGGHVEIINTLKEKGVDFDNLFDQVLSSHNNEVADILLKNNDKNKEKIRPELQLQDSNLMAFNYALQNGIEPLDKTKLILYACECDSMELLKYFIEEKQYTATEADFKPTLDIASEYIHNPLQIAVKNGNYVMLDYLIQHGYDKNIEFCLMNEKHNLLSYSIKLGRENISFLLIDKYHVDHNFTVYKNNKSYTMLIYALKNNSFKIVCKLYGMNVSISECSKILNPNNPPQNSKSPLMYACRHGSIDIARLFMANNEIMSYHTDKSTPLIEAIKSNNLQIVKALVSKGANVNKVTKTTPIGAALEFGASMPIMKFLLESGASLDQRFTPVKGDEKVTPIEYCLSIPSKRSIARTLEDYSYAISKLNSTQKTQIQTQNQLPPPNPSERRIVLEALNKYVQENPQALNTLEEYQRNPQEFMLKHVQSMQYPKNQASTKRVARLLFKPEQIIEIVKNIPKYIADNNKKESEEPPPPVIISSTISIPPKQAQETDSASKTEIKLSTGDEVDAKVVIPNNQEDLDSLKRLIEKRVIKGIDISKLNN
ncbi:hypothetical protein TVAG_385190 [Trichomonas vaginalis G3]|uniref:Uncharacterized protein n=1 Tax=Trichomonas vaginalis (strain ATCC PRA-98 / G3) TaxID=412133 RepID=A2FIY2_TRIV3|nr:protein ubiquitination [Trichomonas vaginalis G3]EAX95131.1 hypothetical protein TVAG_385190 [Trichomonas vaginalis G3]KAI5496070.1 protein ubiquitination [Trichomonas vaginalis G3]|eukprot:XP_001308061.1 hypothetical protein [Trichomonas vaginalis G3]